MTTTSLTRFGAAVMAGIAAIHLVLAPEYFGEQAYLGALFLLGAAAGALITARLWRAADRATSGSFGQRGSASHRGCRAMSESELVGRLAAARARRPAGLPTSRAEWELSGLASLLLEGGFVLAGRYRDPAPAARG